MYIILESSTEQVVSKEEVQGFIKSYDDKDTNIITQYIACAIETAENFLSLSLCSKSVEFEFDLGMDSIIALPVTPIKSIEQIILDGNSNHEVKDLCIISADKKIIQFTKKVAGKIKLLYKTSKIPIKSSIKQGILCHIAQLYDKHSLNNFEMEEILNFYRPFRKILV